MTTVDECAVVAAPCSGPALAAAVFAAWDAGEAILPLNPAAPAAELRRLLAHLRPTHLQDADGRRARPGRARGAGGHGGRARDLGHDGRHRRASSSRARAWRSWAAATRTGSTRDPGDRWLACLPLHHVASLGVLARAYVTGVPWTVHDGFDIDARRAGAARRGRDDGVGRTDRACGASSTRARRCTSTGGSSSAARRARPRCGRGPKQLGVQVVDAYGMTETWGGWALDGIPIEGAEARLADDGELFVRGEMVMRGYRLDPAPDRSRARRRRLARDRRRRGARRRTRARRRSEEGPRHHRRRQREPDRGRRGPRASRRGARRVHRRRLRRGVG